MVEIAKVIFIIVSIILTIDSTAHLIIEYLPEEVYLMNLKNKQTKPFLIIGPVCRIFVFFLVDQLLQCELLYTCTMSEHFVVI